MKFLKEDFHEGLGAISRDQHLTALWDEIIGEIEGIEDSDIKEYFLKSKRPAKSISEAINFLLNQRLTAKGWNPQSKIFKDKELSGKTWTLDFSKSIESKEGKKVGMPIEVVFNHGEAIAWNLIKLSLATENNVKKELDFDKSVGIYICATKNMKDRGGFDGAVGEYEKVLKYLVPFDQKMIRPLVIIGLREPDSFKIERYPNSHPNPKLRGRSTGKLLEIN